MGSPRSGRDMNSLQNAKPETEKKIWAHAPRVSDAINGVAGSASVSLSRLEDTRPISRPEPRNWLEYTESQRSNLPTFRQDSKADNKRNMFQNGSESSRIAELERQVHVLLNIQKNLEKAVEDERLKRMSKDAGKS
jgi:hypothetical protein